MWNLSCRAALRSRSARGHATYRPLACRARVRAAFRALARVGREFWWRQFCGRCGCVRRRCVAGPRAGSDVKWLRARPLRSLHASEPGGLLVMAWQMACVCAVSDPRAKPGRRFFAFAPKPSPFLEAAAGLPHGELWTGRWQWLAEASGRRACLHVGDQIPRE